MRCLGLKAVPQRWSEKLRILLCLVLEKERDTAQMTFYVLKLLFFLITRLIINPLNSLFFYFLFCQDQFIILTLYIFTAHMTHYIYTHVVTKQKYIHT